jgi:hypothetical protein
MSMFLQRLPIWVLVPMVLMLWTLLVLGIIWFVHQATKHDDLSLDEMKWAGELDSLDE